MSSSEVDAYLDGVGQPQRSTLQVVRERVLAALPQAEQTISYGVPAFTVDGVAVAGFSAAKKHCSYFPMSGTVLASLEDRLTEMSWSKGTLRFPVDEPLSAELIADLVRTRLAEIVAR